jgi:aminoglycoside phosphotransferase (APT) family kinase protein
MTPSSNEDTGRTPGVAGVLHDDEIPIGTGLVRALVDRAMPHYCDLPVRRLDPGGSSNALFRLGEDLLVRLPRQPVGSAVIAKEARWLPVLGPLLPVEVPEVVAVFEPGCGYPERWSVVRWIDGEHPGVVTPETPVDPRRGHLAAGLPAMLVAPPPGRPEHAVPGVARWLDDESGETEHPMIIQALNHKPGL